MLPAKTRCSAAPAGLAPDLSGIGVIASAVYLRDSIVKPSEVIVWSPNAGQHQNRPSSPDVHDAFPEDPMFAWSTRDDAAQRISKMPSFAYLPSTSTSTR